MLAAAGHTRPHTLRSVFPCKWRGREGGGVHGPTPTVYGRCNTSLGINGQGAVSALSSGRACPTAFIAHCPHCAPSGPLMIVPASSSLIGWGCERQGLYGGQTCILVSGHPFTGRYPAGPTWPPQLRRLCVPYVEKRSGYRHHRRGGGGGGAGLCLKGRGGGQTRQLQSGCRAVTGDVKAWAVTGGWKCGWGWCWGMGMPLG